MKKTIVQNRLKTEQLCLHNAQHIWAHIRVLRRGGETGNPLKKKKPQAREESVGKREDTKKMMRKNITTEGEENCLTCLERWGDGAKNVLWYRVFAY